MSFKNLEDRMKAAGGALKLLRDSQTGPNPYPVVKPEYTNWRDEQWAWQNTAILFNQSFHMSDLFVSGPESFDFLNYHGINSFKGFEPGKAKQYVPVTWDGHVIGDVILVYLAKNKFDLVGRPPVINWISYHAETGKNPKTGKKWQVTLVRDDRSADRKNPWARKFYRFQIQGPNAMKVTTKLLKKTPPELKMFNWTTLKIAGKQVGALRHGMAGQPGYELFGPMKDYEAVHSAIVKAGEEFGLRLVGGRAYSSNTLESAWIPSPMPGIYSGDEKYVKYRKWLPADSFEGNASLGGSYYSKDVSDYYVTPFDLGYGFMIKYDHEFIGKAALEKIHGNKHRIKVTLELVSEDVQKVIASQYDNKANAAERGKFFEYPSAVYSMYPQDKVLSKDGKQVGISTWVGYSSNERKELTLAYVEPEFAAEGTEVIFVWGEEGGGSLKPTVERPHKQFQIRAKVCKAPYVQEVQKAYADAGSWRAAGKQS
jgi:glycine cleavage system aminomethyltransferase T